MTYDIAFLDFLGFLDESTFDAKTRYAAEFGGFPICATEHQAAVQAERITVVFARRRFTRSASNKIQGRELEERLWSEGRKRYERGMR